MRNLSVRGGDTTGFYAANGLEQFQAGLTAATISHFLIRKPPRPWIQVYQS